MTLVVQSDKTPKGSAARNFPLPGGMIGKRDALCSAFHVITAHDRGHKVPQELLSAKNESIGMATFAVWVRNGEHYVLHVDIVDTLAFSHHVADLCSGCADRNSYRPS